MIDSFSAYNNIPNSDIKRIMNTLKNVREEVIKDTGEVRYKATTSNKTINILINGNRLSINGSLSQYYKENYSSLLWNEASVAISKLEDELQVNLSNLNTTSIDIENTFSVYHQPKSYFEFLGDAPHYNRFIEKNTLYYNSGNRKIRVYDKSKKIKKDSKIPNVDILNYIRFEVSFKSSYIGKIGNKLGVEKMKIKHIFNSDIQKYLLDLWLREYRQINKHPKLNLDMNNVQGFGELKNKLLLSKIDDLGGVTEVIDMIKRSSSSKLDSKAMYKIKTGLKELSGKPMNVLPCSHLDELNESISIAYIKNYLSIC